MIMSLLRYKLAHWRNKIHAIVCSKNLKKQCIFNSFQPGLMIFVVFCRLICKDNEIS